MSRGSLSGGLDLCPGGLCRETPQIRKAGGTHPTGMLPCLIGEYIPFLNKTSWALEDNLVVSQKRIQQLYIKLYSFLVICFLLLPCGNEVVGR